MKTSELRELSKNELDIKLKELNELLLRYRFQTAMGQFTNTAKFKQAKKEIARILTILNQKSRADSIKLNKPSV
jgi:large subunit ribosomal protein L29